MRRNYCGDLSSEQKRQFVSKAFNELTTLMQRLILTAARERQCSRKEAESFLRYCDGQYATLYAKGIALSSFLLYGQDSTHVQDVLKGVA